MALSAACNQQVIEDAQKKTTRLYNTLVQPHAKRVIDLFMKQYPFIDATFCAEGTQVYSKLMIEPATVTNGYGFIDQPRICLRPETKEHYKPVQVAGARDVQRRFAGSGSDRRLLCVAHGLGFNTRMVKKTRFRRLIKICLARCGKEKRFPLIPRPRVSHD